MPRGPDPLPPPMNARGRLGAALRQLRKLNGLTQAELAAAVDCSHPTVSQMERGRHTPSEDLVRAWDERLGGAGVLVSLYEELLEERRHARRRRAVTGRADTPKEPRPIPGDASEFIADVTIPDGTLMAPGERFIKTWRIHNVGTVSWRGRHLARLGPAGAEGQVSTPPQVPIPDTEPGEVVDVSVPCRAHVLAGSSQAHFKMADEDGRFYFPDRYSAGLVLAITVVSGEMRLRTGKESIQK